jgi:hypothetical protein
MEPEFNAKPQPKRMENPPAPHYGAACGGWKEPILRLHKNLCKSEQGEALALRRRKAGML